MGIKAGTWQWPALPDSIKASYITNINKTKLNKTLVEKLWAMDSLVNKISSTIIYCTATVKSITAIRLLLTISDKHRLYRTCLRMNFSVHIFYGTHTQTSQARFFLLLRVYRCSQVCTGLIARARFTQYGSKSIQTIVTQHQNRQWHHNKLIPNKNMDFRPQQRPAT